MNNLYTVCLQMLQALLKISCFFKLYKTPLGETGCLGNPFFTGCLSIQFFDSPLTLTESVRLPMVTYPSLYSTCVTYGTRCHAIGHQVLPTPASVIPHPSLNYRQVFRPILYFQPTLPQPQLQPLPSEAEDFPRVIGILSMCLRSHT